MPVVIEDKNPRKVELTPMEIEIIKDALLNDSFQIVRFYNYKHRYILKKLERVLEKKEAKK